MTKQAGYDYFLENALKYGWMIPQGLIAMWKGTIATIPAGWALCNGSNGTPDLRDKFVVGATQDDGVAKTNIQGVLLQEGGAISHSHQLSGITDEGYAAVTNTGHDHTSGDNPADVSAGEDFAVWDSQEASSISTDIVTDSGHQHNITEVDSTENENVPPYYALAFIMKT